MTIIEQLVEDYKNQNPSATPEQVKEYIQSLEQHTKVIKEDEWAFNTEHDTDEPMSEDLADADDNTKIITGSTE